MKNIIFIISLSFILNSCITPGNFFENDQQTIGLDLSKGKWILNEIDSPNNYKIDLVENANKEFISLLGDKFSYAPTTKGILIPKKISLNPTAESLKDLKKGTNSDFFINIKGDVRRDDLEGLNGSFRSDIGKEKKSVTEITLEVYDLNLLQTIYSRKVISTLSVPTNKADFYILSKNKNMLVGGFKKLIKDIKQKSIISK